MDGLVVFCVAALAVHLVGLAIVVIRSNRRPRTVAPSEALPPVTILRPVCGLENQLAETLGSTFELEHPEVETIFCVASPTDAAIPLIEALIAANPDRPARLLVGDERISINPKLNNLVKGWAAARHDWILMVDSNVAMPPDMVGQALARFDDRTGLVCAPPLGVEPDGFGAELECAWLNGFQARWQLAADAFGFGFAQGKVMVWQRATLEAAGGIARLAAEVAEDAASTKIVRAGGKSVRLLDRPAPQPLGRRTLAEVWRRQVRWARLRRASFPVPFAAEILAGGAVPMAAMAVLAAEAVATPAAALAYVLLWYGSELAAIRAAGWPASRWSLPAMVARDLALPALWLSALTGNGFVWRGNPMAVAVAEEGGRARRVRRKVIARLKAITASREP